MNLIAYFKDIKDYFSPKIVGEVNDTYIKIVKIKGDKVPWHAHENEDELFYILEGSLLFEVEGKENFILNQGDFYIVKQGIKHRVSSKEECKIMLIEPKTTAHTGSVKSEITKSISDQQ
ncbi:cupin domain-containing protein [Saprospiraceae bacterium]|jgi:quercetin dioxygenase-like cupin family protein|nr:cupin domain-containing protein [Bacteroidota bacterium]MDB4728107.1 cupin domain-containing protein [Saprospiraceae bacterium]MDF1866197.1 cupin domain-containing protein [Saprospiraceae bacterium]